MKKEFIMCGKKIIITTLTGVAISLTSCTNSKQSSSSTIEIDSSSVTVTKYQKADKKVTTNTSKIIDSDSSIKEEQTTKKVTTIITPHEPSSSLSIDESSLRENDLDKLSINLDNTYISFSDIDISESIYNIQKNKTKFYFKDIIQPDLSLNKYNSMEEYNSGHDLKYLSAGKVNTSLLKSKILENNKKYLDGEHRACFKECTSSEFDIIFNNLVKSIETNIYNDVDEFELDDVLDGIKLLSLTGSVKGEYISYENILGINFELLNKVGLSGSVDVICLHEANHVIQSGSVKEKDNEGYEKNLGILYQWNDLKVNALNYQWFIEASAEKLVSKCTTNNNETYQYMLETLDTMYLSSIFNNEVDEYTLASISLQPNLTKMFEYFNCDDNDDKIEKIMMFYTYDIINNSKNTEFKDAYKEEYGSNYSISYNDNLECQCAEVLAKNFYCNLIKGLSSGEETLSNILYVIKVFECDLNNKTKTSYIRNEDQKVFIENYLNVRKVFFELLSKKTNLSLEEINYIYNSYDVNNNSFLSSNYFNENQKIFVKNIEKKYNANNSNQLVNYKIK